MKNKKAFTVVELVIVIAIIAILAAVLIPTFASLIKKANVSKDQQLIRNLNTALATSQAERNNKPHANMTEALEAAEKFGYEVGKINASGTDNEILWDSKNDVFCYYDAGKGTVEYIPESVISTNKPASSGSPEYWCIVTEKNVGVAFTGTGNEATLSCGRGNETIPKNWSCYLAAVKDGVTAITTATGVDVGETTALNTINYVNASAQTVIIRTNGGILKINAAEDTVKHFGKADFLDIEAVGTSSYHEFGLVLSAQIKVGRVINEVFEDGLAGIQNLFLIAKDADNDGIADSFDTIIIGAAPGAKLPTLDRTDVEIGDGVRVCEIQTGVNGETIGTKEWVWLFGDGTIASSKVVVTDSDSKPSDTGAINTATASGKAGYELANIPGQSKPTLADLTTAATLFAGGAGTENNPYLIATPEQFLKIEKGSEGNSKYYLMVNNIDFDDATYTPKKLGAQPFNAWCLISNSSSTQVKDIHFNGGGHDLSLSLNDCDVQGANRLCLFAYLGGTSVLENFNIVIDNYQTGEHCFFTLVDYSGWASEDHLTFKDITTKSNDPNVVISGTLYNNGIFTSQTYYGKVDFINCDNYVNLNGTNNMYYAPYIGGYIQSYSQVSFTDCDNYGNLSGVGSAAMFIGNNTNINKNSVTITNSYNYGTIRAASASGLFAQNSNSANAREIEELYLASCNRGIISVQSFNGFTYSIKENEINYNLTNTNNVGKIVLRINGHTSVLDNNNEYIGARGFQITQEISPVNSTNGTFTYKLGQVIRQLDYNLDIELSNSNKIYDDGEYVKVYYVEKDNQAYYVFNDDYGNYSVSNVLSIAITAYSSNGSILGNAVLEEN